MMFGGPTHRLQAQIQSTAKVLDIPLSCMYLPDVMLISFDDTATSTSNIKFIRQGSALDIGKLQDAHFLYWKVRYCPTTDPHPLKLTRRCRSFMMTFRSRMPLSLWTI